MVNVKFRWKSIPPGERPPREAIPIYRHGIDGARDCEHRVLQVNRLEVEPVSNALENTGASVFNLPTWSGWEDIGIGE